MTEPRYAAPRQKTGQEVDICLYCHQVITRDRMDHPYNPSWIENPRYTEWWHRGTGFPRCEAKEAAQQDR